MKSFLVLGLGRFGVTVAKTLCSLGNEVLAVDKNAEIVNDIAEDVTHAIVGDMCDENVLRSFGVTNFDAVIVAVTENMEVSLMTTMILKELGARKIIVKSSGELHAKILTKIGADKVVMPESDMGIKMAQSLTQSGLIDFIELSSEYSIAEIAVPSSWYGRSLMEVNVRVRYGINVIAVKNGDAINAELSADYVFAAGDVVVAIGSNKKLDKIK